LPFPYSLLGGYWMNRMKVFEIPIENVQSLQSAIGKCPEDVRSRILKCAILWICSFGVIQLWRSRIFAYVPLCWPKKNWNAFERSTVTLLSLQMLIHCIFCKISSGVDISGIWSYPMISNSISKYQMILDGWIPGISNTTDTWGIYRTISRYLP